MRQTLSLWSAVRKPESGGLLTPDRVSVHLGPFYVQTPFQSCASPLPEGVLAVLAHKKVDCLAHQGLKGSSVLGRQHI